MIRHIPMLKNLISRVIPIEMIRAPLFAMAVRRTGANRRRLLGRLPNFPTVEGVVTSLLIVPSDPALIVGSKGDDAMMSVVIEQARARDQKCHIGIVSSGRPVPKKVQDWGVTIEPIWTGTDLFPFLEALSRYQAVIVVGADVMDGHYSVADAARYWAYVDLAARCGRRASVLGFSFKKDAARKLRPFVDNVHPTVDLCIRDEVSLGYLSEFSRARGRLVADSAFLLAPCTTSPDWEPTRLWASAQRDMGRLVCAVNLHPMIFEDEVEDRCAALVSSAAAAFRQLADEMSVAFLLVPHDFRGLGRGDAVVLTPLYESLRKSLGDRITYARSNSSAAETKAIARLADRLVTARMHLGVGGLSLGLPIAGITFQEKFKGLLKHFGIPESMVLSPEHAIDPRKLTAFFREALLRTPIDAAAVAKNLPNVMTMAMRNFAILDGSSPYEEARRARIDRAHMRMDAGS